MAIDDILAQVADLDRTLASIEAVSDLPAKRAEVATLEEQAAAPDLWSDQEHAQKVTSTLSRLQAELDRLAALRSRLEDAGVLLDLAVEEGDAAAVAEAEREVKKLAGEIEALEIRTLLSGDYDGREALVTIRSEAGGVDAADFAEMLLRMYLRWADRHGYAVEVYDTSYAEEAGIKSATFTVKAPFAYGTLSVEQGTHRLVERRW